MYDQMEVDELIVLLFEGYGDHLDINVLNNSFPTRRASDLRQERGVEMIVAGNDLAGLQHRVAALGIGDETAGLANEEDPRGDVPRLYVELPIAVASARGDIGKIERGGADPPYPGHLAAQRFQRRPVARMVAEIGRASCRERG